MACHTIFPASVLFNLACDAVTRSVIHELSAFARLMFNGAASGVAVSAVFSCLQDVVMSNALAAIARNVYFIIWLGY